MTMTAERVVVEKVATVRPAAGTVTVVRAHTTTTGRRRTARITTMTISKTTPSRQEGTTGAAPQGAVPHFIGFGRQRSARESSNGRTSRSSDCSKRHSRKPIALSVHDVSRQGFICGRTVRSLGPLIGMKGLLGVPMESQALLATPRFSK